MHPKQYDLLLSQKNPRMERIVRVHPQFRVIAIGIPVPPFPGNPLDPPLRSRFQSLLVSPLAEEAMLRVMTDIGGSPAQIACLINLASFLRRSGSRQSAKGGIEGTLLAYHQ